MIPHILRAVEMLAEALRAHDKFRIAGARRHLTLMVDVWRWTRR
jgi:hypothetical protein